MKIIRSEILDTIPQISFGLSTRSIPTKADPFGFNLSFHIGDDEKRVLNNREKFFNNIGLKTDEVAYHYQIHEDDVKYVDKSGFVGESDALITDKPNIGLAITTADCAAIFIYDRVKNVIGAVHSGWRGTSKKILKKTLKILANEYGSKPNNLIVYIAPSISQKNYEVGDEVASQFDEKYLIKSNDKFLLDVSAANYNILLNFGIPKDQVEKSNLCSFDSEFLHSYRRDGNLSGRALGVIVMKE